MRLGAVGFLLIGAVVACGQIAGIEDGKLAPRDAEATGGSGNSGGSSTGGATAGGGGAPSTGGVGGAAGGTGGSEGGAAGACSGTKVPCQGTCVDLATDGKNCNTCGHSCLGGACVGGACQPVALATGQAYPIDLAVDAAYVYWTIWGTSAQNYNDGEIRKCAIGGCSNRPITLAKSSGEPTSIAVDSTDFYFGNHSGHSIERCPLSGCAVPEVVASGVGDPRGIALDANNVYSVAYDTGVVFKCAKSGCGSAPTPIASGLSSPFGIAVDGTNVYAGGSTVFQIPLGGGTPTTLATGQFARGIAVSQTDVYWANHTTGSSGLIARCAIGGCGKNPTVLIVQSSGEPSDVALDAQNVYWTNDKTGEIMRCPLAGCGATTVPLVTGQDSPQRIVVDSKAIYWVNAGTVGTTSGAVMKLAK